MKKNSTASIHIRIPAKLKKEAEQVIEALGLDASSAIRLFYTQVTIHQTLPFQLPKIRPMSAKTKKIVEEALKDEMVGPFNNAEDLLKSLYAED